MIKRLTDDVFMTGMMINPFYRKYKITARLKACASIYIYI